MERHSIAVNDGEIILIVDECGIYDVSPLSKSNVRGHFFVAEVGDDDRPWVIYTRNKARVVVLPPSEQWYYATVFDFIEDYHDLWSCRFHHMGGADFEGALCAVVSKYRLDLVEKWARADEELMLLDAPLPSDESDT